MRIIDKIDAAHPDDPEGAFDGYALSWGEIEHRRHPFRLDPVEPGGDADAVRRGAAHCVVRPRDLDGVIGDRDEDGLIGCPYPYGPCAVLHALVAHDYLLSVVGIALT